MSLFGTTIRLEHSRVSLALAPRALPFDAAEG